MTMFHNRIVRMKNMPKVVELDVSWDDIYKLIHKKVSLEKLQQWHKILSYDTNYKYLVYTSVLGTHCYKTEALSNHHSRVFVHLIKLRVSNVFHKTWMFWNIMLSSNSMINLPSCQETHLHRLTHQHSKLLKNHSKIVTQTNRDDISLVQLTHIDFEGTFQSHQCTRRSSTQLQNIVKKWCPEVPNK